MNSTIVAGRLIEIQQPRRFETSGSAHEYRTVVIENESGMLAIDAWGNLVHDTGQLKVGDVVSAKIKIISQRNRKTPEVFYHKLNLQSIKTIVKSKTNTNEVLSNQSRYEEEPWN